MLKARLRNTFNRFEKLQGGNWQKHVKPALGDGLGLTSEAISHVAVVCGWRDQWMVDEVSARAKNKARRAQALLGQQTLNIIGADETMTPARAREVANLPHVPSDASEQHLIARPVVSPPTPAELARAAASQLSSGATVAARPADFLALSQMALARSASQQGSCQSIVAAGSQGTQTQASASQVLQGQAPNRGHVQQDQPAAPGHVPLQGQAPVGAPLVLTGPRLLQGPVTVQGQGSTEGQQPLESQALMPDALPLPGPSPLEGGPVAESQELHMHCHCQAHHP